jgi:hypothetical protein
MELTANSSPHFRLSNKPQEAFRYFIFFFFFGVYIKVAR